MKAKQRALTRVEVVVGIAALLALLLLLSLLFLPFSLGINHEPLRKIRCTENLKELGKAITAYREDNGGYFPFSWQRAGDPEPDGIGRAQAAMAATSLGNLYPRYLQNAEFFRCPSTENGASFTLNLPMEYREKDLAAKLSGGLPGGINWTLTSARTPSDYGYDPRVSPRAGASRALMADMDGSWQVNHDTPTQNHIRGQNVLYLDGHVKWQETNFCSTDPNDNIFAENAWDADTDTYLLSKDAGLMRVSFDGYKHLHYPQQAKP